MTGQLLGELSSIETESGISATTREAFCIIRAVTTTGDIIYGQLDPAILRELAMGFLRTADAAESDAAVYAQFAEMGMPDEGIAQFVTGLRNRRPA